MDKGQTGFKIQAKTQTQAGPTVNAKSGLYRKDAAAFHGDDKFEVESQGTQFQQNAAAFIGTDAPAQGERPFKIDKKQGGINQNAQGKSYLNEQRLHQHVSKNRMKKVSL